MIPLYIVLHVLLCAVAYYLLIQAGQTLFWRFVMGVLVIGGLWNMAGLIWLGYSNIWPGEPIITGGFVLWMLGVIFSKRPLVTHGVYGATKGR